MGRSKAKERQTTWSLFGTLQSFRMDIFDRGSVAAVLPLAAVCQPTASEPHHLVCAGQVKRTYCC